MLVDVGVRVWGVGVEVRGWDVDNSDVGGWGWGCMWGVMRGEVYRSGRDVVVIQGHSDSSAGLSPHGLSSTHR